MPKEARAKKKGSLKRLDLYGLTEAVEIIRQCLDEEKEVPVKFTDNVWDDAMNLEPVLNFVAQPTFVPPQGFSEAMDTFVSLFAKSDDRVSLSMLQELHEVLQEPGTQDVMKYLDWLTPAMEKVASATGNSDWSPSKRPARQAAQVRNALNLWPGECAKLRENAGALFEALCEHGGNTLEQVAHWRRCVDLIKVIQAQQEDECCRIAEELDRTSQRVVRDIRNDCEDHDEWPKIAKTTESALLTVKRLSTEKLDDRQKKTASATEEYEALGAEQKRCCAAVMEAREQAGRQVRRLQQAEKIFLHVAGQLVGWTRDLTPKLRDLAGKRQALEQIMKLNEEILNMEPEQLEAEQELDDFSAELDRLRRQAADEETGRKRRSVIGSPTAAQPISVKKRLGQVEERQKLAQKRATLLESRLAEAHAKREAALAALPFKLAEPTHEEELASVIGVKGKDKHGYAAKLLAVENIHKQMSVPIETNDPTMMLDQVATARQQAALQLGVHQAFVCPLTLQIMKEPVVAADGYSYEKKAIKLWLRRSDVPCSPMAGTVLRNKSTLDNFNLRSVIDSMCGERSSLKEAKPRKKQRGSKDSGKADAASAIQRAFRQSIVRREGATPPQSPSRAEREAKEAAAIREKSAATRIQANFRGHKARSMVAEEKQKRKKKAAAAAAVAQDRAAVPVAKAAPAPKPAQDQESSSEYYDEDSESEYETDDEPEDAKKAGAAKR